MDQRNNQENQNQENQVKRRQTWTVGLFITLVISQIILKRNGLPTPSDVISAMGTFFKEMFIDCGKYIMKVIHKIAEYISIPEIASELYNILHAIFMFLFSPYFILQGFFSEFTNDFYGSLFAALSVFVLVTIILVFLQRSLSENVQPLTIMNALSDLVKAIYRRVGIIFADLCSFLVLLRLDQYIHDVIALSHPFFGILLSPFKSVSGYFGELSVVSVGKRTAMVFGTLIIVALYFYGGSIVGFSNDFMNLVFAKPEILQFVVIGLGLGCVGYSILNKIIYS